MIQLKLADGSIYALVAADNNAADIVAQCSVIMQLQPAVGPARIVVATVDNSAGQTCTSNTFTVDWTAVSSNGTDEVLVCNLGPIFEEDASLISFFEEGTAPFLFHDRQAQYRKLNQISSLALGIARDVLSRGGMLLHGALAVGPCGGVILLGPSGVGKSTASGRLSPPWRSLSDDSTLIVRDAQGQYWAHPWPTWSQFYDDGPGGSWDVQRAVPLRGLFFLAQDTEDRIIAISTGQVINLLLEAMQQTGSSLTHDRSETVMRAILQDHLAAVMALAETVPAHILNISLTGAFWEEIERVLPVDHMAPQRPTQTKSVTTSAELVSDDAVKYAVTIGSSMAPTLREADVLITEPYREQPVRRGDVVCFLPPKSNYAIVQRVTRITAKGIHTRSDNPEHAVRHCLQPAHIIGRVLTARCDRRQRQITGSWRGHLTGVALRLRWSIRQANAKLWNCVYDILAQAGMFQHIVLPHLKPRVIFFQRSWQPWSKIMMGGRVVGRYDHHEKEWIILFPFRLFIDEDRLPQFPHLTPPQFFP